MKPARAYVHAPAWPFHRIGELTTASSIDRAWSLMQPGAAALAIARNEAVSPDVLSTGNLLVIESDRTPPWCGYILAIEESLGGGDISISALEMTAALDARLTSEFDVYETKIASGAVFSRLIAQVNARAFCGFAVPALLPAGEVVEDLDLAAQSALDALDELHERTDNEWWAEYSVRPQRVEATLHWGLRQGLDFSSIVHLYEGRHFSRLEYRQDATKVQESITAYGGGGAPSGRSAVTRATSGSAGHFTSNFEQAGAATVRAIADAPQGLRAERAVYVPGTENTTELSRESRRAMERPLGASEQFAATVNGHADWMQLALGNTVTVVADLATRRVSRAMRIVGVQPDEEMGECELVLEVAL